LVKCKAEAAAASEMLSEIGKHSDAIDLALSFDVVDEVGYSLSQAIIDHKEGDPALVSHEMQWMKLSIAHIEAEFVTRLNADQLLSTAKCLILSGEALPLALIRRLHSVQLTSEVIKHFLTKCEHSDANAESLYLFLTGGREGANESMDEVMKTLCEQDVNSAPLLLNKVGKLAARLGQDAATLCKEYEKLRHEYESLKLKRNDQHALDPEERLKLESELGLGGQILGDQNDEQKTKAIIDKLANRVGLSSEQAEQIIKSNRQVDCDVEQLPLVAQARSDWQKKQAILSKFQGLSAEILGRVGDLHKKWALNGNQQSEPNAQPPPGPMFNFHR